MPDISTQPEAIRELLRRARTIAIVGLSPKADRPSNEVARYLRTAGYRIIPVNPGHTEILGEKCYPSLAAIPFQIDIVDIFRRSEDAPAVIEEAIAGGAGSVWLQLGVSAPTACAAAVAAGLHVVVNRCSKVDHANLLA